MPYIPEVYVYILRRQPAVSAVCFRVAVSSNFLASRPCVVVLPCCASLSRRAAPLHARCLLPQRALLSTVYCLAFSHILSNGV